MRLRRCFLAAALLSSPALAQVQPGSSALPSPSDISNRDTLTIGFGAASVPDYEGSNDYRIIPAAAVRGKYHGISFNTNGSFLFVDVVPASGNLTFDAGPVLGLRFDGRRHSKDPVVRLMTRRSTAFEVGAFAGVSFHGLLDPYDTLSARLGVRHDVAGAHRSTVFNPNLSFSTPVSRKTYVSLNAGAEFVSRKFADYYFGVSPDDVAATGGALPLYSPRGGMKNWKASLLVDQSITGDLLGGLSVFGLGQYSRLLGDFRRSPIVAQRGSPNQWIAAAGLAYTW
jgi:outer membrane scaffolding protein for murein synthesis (MipA/OmpV family)